MSSLGDLVLLVPSLLRLRRAAPAAHIHLLVKRRYASLFEGAPFLDEIITFEGGGALELVRLRGRLSRERYDAVIDAHGVFRSSALYHSLRAPIKLRIKKGEIAKSLLIAAKVNVYRRVATQSERYDRLIDALGVARDEHGSGEMPLPPAARDAARVALESCSKGARLVAFAPGARWDTKRWPLESFAELMRQTAGRGFSTVLIGGPDDAMLSAAVSRSVSPSPDDLTGKLSILESAAVLERCAALVTNDSAPLHLAEAVGTPVIAFFGPTVREFGYFPRLPRSIALEAPLGCRPCSRNGSRACPYGTKECLASISPVRAMEALSRAIGKGKAIE